MQTTLQARMTTGSQHRLAPEPNQAFWIPMLIRPAPLASPPRNAIVQHLAPISTQGAPCVVPANVANDPAVADAGDAGANDASDAAELEAKRAAELEAHLAFELEIERELKRWADRSAEHKAELAARRTPGSDEVADAPARPADVPAARRGDSPLRERGVRGAAIVAALALTAMAIVVLSVPGLAGAPVSAIRREPGLSARPSAGASDLVTVPPRAGARPIIAPPAERVAPRAAAPAPVAREPAPAEPAVAAPAACEEAVVETAPATFALTPSETPLDANHDLKDRTDELPIVPVGAIAGEPVSEAPPEVSTSAPLQERRPPRGRAQHRRVKDTDDAPVGTRVTPTSRDLLDVATDVPASGP